MQQCDCFIVIWTVKKQSPTEVAEFKRKTGHQRAYLLSCWGLDDKSDTTVMSVCSNIKLKPIAC